MRRELKVDVPGRVPAQDAAHHIVVLAHGHQALGVLRAHGRGGAGRQGKGHQDFEDLAGAPKVARGGDEQVCGGAAGGVVVDLLVLPGTEILFCAICGCLVSALVTRKA